MDQMPLSTVIFYSIPEGIILFSFGVVIVGESLNFKKIFITATIGAFTTMLLRAYVPYYGLHTIIGIFALFLLFWKPLNLKPWKAIISSLTSLTTLMLIETITLPIIFEIQHFTLTELWKDNFRRIIYPYPDLALYGAITWFLYARKISLVTGSGTDRENEYNNARFLVALIVLFQGTFLAIINAQLDFLGNYALLIKLLFILFFVLSMIFIKWLFRS
jgi:hypothetical protein